MAPKISKRRGRASRDENDAQAHSPIGWLRFPIILPVGRKLRVLIYARFSTDDQKHSRSIEAQIRYCKAFLQHLGITDVEFTIIEDRAISGEVVSRPGIDKVKAGILAGSGI